MANHLSVTKTVSDATPNVGDQITFTVTLSNPDPDTATGVQVTDLLPAGLTFVSATPSQGTYDNVSGVWTVGTVSSGVPQTLSITATVVSPAAQTNTGTISGADQVDPNTANNTASATETPQQADLSVSKTVSDATPNVGDQITFTVTATNAGPDAATGVQVTDLLPAGLTFVSATPSQGTYDNVSGVWTVGTVSSGVPQTLSITATVVSPAALTNTGTISDADQFDPSTANNSGSATETPQQADLSVSKTVSDATPNVGDQITFTVTATNAGPDAATGVQVTDLLPAGLTFVSATPSQGTYDNVSGVWTVGTVSSGVPQTLSITATVVSPAAQTNTGTISDADQFDPSTANNSGSATETPQQADLSVSKTVSDATPNVGDQITFTVTATNAGPDAATGVQVTDLLPAGLTFVSATPSQGTYDNVSGVWTVGTVSSGVPQTLSITATVVSPAAQTNTGTISDADQFDPSTANNSASATETPQQAGSDDVLVANDSGPQTLDGGAGNDTLLGLGSGNYLLDGGTGNDLLNASGSGNETLTGGDGNDTLASFGTGTYALDGGDGSDSLQANGAGAEALTGGNGDDTLQDLASAGGHSLDGGNGNDLLNYGGTGTNNDVLTGGLGNDTLQELASAGNHSLDGGNGDDLVNLGGSANDTATGGNGNDTLVAFGAGTYALDGGDGNDSLQTFGQGAETLAGGNGNDTLQDLAASGGHSLDGGNGDDIVNLSGFASDTATGGNGNDTLVAFGAGVYSIDGGDGNDSLQTSGAGAETLLGGNGDDTLLELSAAAHSLDGGNGNDTVNYSGSGADTLLGGAGNDTLAVFGTGTVSADAGADDDRILFGPTAGSSDTLDGGAGTDTVVFQGKTQANIVSESTTAGVTTIVFTAGSGGQTAFVQNVELFRFGDNSTQAPPYPTIP